MQTPLKVEQGEIYWCEPDPLDTVGSEQEKDRPWVVVSVSRLHRGNCVVAVPLSRQLDKAVGHLILIPKGEFRFEVGNIPFDCVALTDQIRCLDKTRFRRKAGRISKQGLSSVLLGLQALFGM
jgi:mRNA-degrading endonuclease toxin of MazEF toxin-antitoxin module